MNFNYLLEYGELKGANWLFGSSPFRIILSKGLKSIYTLSVI